MGPDSTPRRTVSPPNVRSIQPTVARSFLAPNRVHLGLPTPHLVSAARTSGPGGVTRRVTSVSGLPPNGTYFRLSLQLR
ncbi:hypothetical protein RISK_004343 [Rhodopirellula islandica]|uniref:Uncharacterized protein n=1 Tax=Rhodopirellula islandica TaxID=595434 RepID=A0A0J1BBP1_RHOIS|nr:hypothetical protein RISK_004343 [Rhodopirellula islandica]